MKEAVLAIVLQKGLSKILLVKRKDTGLWALPGGGVDPHEKRPDAILREVKEEAHVQCQILRLGAYLYPVNRLTVPTSIYVCETTQSFALPSDETLESHFFSLTNLPNSLFYLHQQWLNEILSSECFIERPMKEINYSTVFRYAWRHPCTFVRFLFHKIKSASHG